MRKARRTLPIVLPALAVLVISTVVGHAKRPTPLPPLVTLTGGITILPEGTKADPNYARVEFVDSSLHIQYPGITPPEQDPATYTQGQVFASNPDQSRIPPNTPSLWVISTGANKTLTYFYCAHILHADAGDLRCDLDHGEYYYCLVIYGGKAQKTGDVVFPAGSSWKINKKTPDQGVNVAAGILSMPVTYKVVQ